MLQILTKEFSSFLNSFIAYVVISVFLTAIGLLTWVFPETSLLNNGYAQLDTLFLLGPYVFVFLVPAITMRSFAEEKKAGTMEMLLTKPVSDWQIVSGKFMACFVLVLFALLPTLIYYYTVYALGNPVGNIDTPGVMGSYIGLALLGGVFCSAGISASSISSNQIIAFILGAFLCFLLYAGFDSLASMMSTASGALFVRQLGIVYHYEALSKGLIDSRDVIYFISTSVLMLAISKLILGSRQW